MTPALSPQEWSDGWYGGVDLSVHTARPGIDGRPRLAIDVYAHPVSASNDLHALAAVALHKQPFGFTYEDSRALLEAAVALRVVHADDAAVESVMSLHARYSRRAYDGFYPMHEVCLSCA